MQFCRNKHNVFQNCVCASKKKKKKSIFLHNQLGVFCIPLLIFIGVNEQSAWPTSTIPELCANRRAIASQVHYYSVKKWENRVWSHWVQNCQGLTETVLNLLVFFKTNMPGGNITSPFLGYTVCRCTSSLAHSSWCCNFPIYILHRTHMNADTLNNGVLNTYIDIS